MQELNEETNLDEFKIGNYHTQEFIGNSTTGSVYKAFNESSGDVCAIKILKYELGKHEKFMNCLKEEMSHVKKLQHPNIVKVLEIAKDKDKSFLVLEYVDGKNLKEILSETPKLPIEQCIELMMQMALALDYSASNGVLHKSLKPQSIMVSNNNWVKLTGFGVSKALATAWLTLTGSSNAQVEYMSPEQAEGEDMDQRADIYSFGILAYQMITGEVPFKREKSASILSVAMKHINDMPHSLISKNPEVPDWLERVVLKCLEKKAIDRYQRGKELFDDLKNRSFSNKEPMTYTASHSLENTDTKTDVSGEIKEIVPNITPKNQPIKNILIKKETLSNVSVKPEYEETRKNAISQKQAKDEESIAPPPPPPPPKILNPTRPLVITSNSIQNLSSEELKNSLNKGNESDSEIENNSSKNNNKLLLIVGAISLFIFIIAMFILLSNAK